MIVRWGGNLFRDCVALLSYGDRVVLAVSGPPIRIDLAAPPPVFPAALDIRQNQLLGGQPDHFKVSGTPDLETPQALTIVANGRPVLMAQAIAADEIILHVDLRALGVNIFDDASGLHVGDSTLANNTFEGSSAAIALR